MNTLPDLPFGCKHIPDFPGYCADSDGNIYSCHNNKWGFSDIWKQIKPGTNNNLGRKIVVLIGNDGLEHSAHVHRLILSAFVGPCPPEMIACHNNGNGWDNRLSNLRWDTKSANYQDTRFHGKKKGENHPLAVLNDDIVREIRRRAANKETQQSIADALGIQRRNVGRVIDCTRWGHVV